MDKINKKTIYNKIIHLFNYKKLRDIIKSKKRFLTKILPILSIKLRKIFNLLQDFKKKLLIVNNFNLVKLTKILNKIF